MTGSQIVIVLVIVCFGLSACNVTKSLPPEEKLYTGSDMKVKGPELSAKQKKALVSDLKSLIRPKPNSRFIGIPFKLVIYNTFRKSKPKSFFGKFRDKNGEPPVLLSSVDLEQTEQVLQNHLQNKGFFKAEVKGDTLAKSKKGKASYSIATDYQYHIRKVMFSDDSSLISQAIRQSAKQTLIQTGSPFDIDIIKGERMRIDAYLKERGYYFFSPDYLLAKVDSTVGHHTVDVKLEMKPKTSDKTKQVYHIGKIFIYSGYNINITKIDTTKRADTTRENMQYYNGFYVIDRRKRFKPLLFTNVMQFRPGDIYNRSDHNQTLNRLISLNEFKFVKNRFEPVADSTALLNVYYYLIPLRKKSLRTELTGMTKSNNMNGSQITFSWLNRNTFRGGEQLSLSTYVGTEIQFGGNKKGYNTYRSGAEMNLTIPRYIIPLFDIKTKGGFVPRTNIKLGYDILNRKKLYTVNSFRLGWGYIWKESIEKQHELYPINVTYVQPVNVTQEYRDSVEKYPYLRNVIDSQFIIGATYLYNFNQLTNNAQRTNSFYFNGLIDIAGNIVGLLKKKEGNDKAKIFNAPFDQYLKLEADFRYYRRFNKNTTWANRLILGYGLPYGNSDKIPYIKQFFSGGNNSIRAFRSRSLLGAYLVPNTGKNAYPDLTGDLKVEVNTELRPKISGPVYGALFIDAGNTWLRNKDTTQPGAEFSSHFLKDMAAGVGLGLRLDIQIFVIRLDVAFPIRKPWESNPWVIEQIRLGNAQWRKENIIYNLAIGYPF